MWTGLDNHGNAAAAVITQAVLITANASGAAHVQPEKPEPIIFKSFVYTGHLGSGGLRVQTQTFVERLQAAHCTRPQSPQVHSKANLKCSLSIL